MTINDVSCRLERFANDKFFVDSIFGLYYHVTKETTKTFETQILRFENALHIVKQGIFQNDLKNVGPTNNRNQIAYVTVEPKVPDFVINIDFEF